MRLASADAQAVLSQFRDSPLLAAGKLCILALDAVAERLGPRWPSRRDLVHEHASKTLRHALAPEALVLRISETEYIVAQPEAPKAAGQLRCIGVLRDILTHFLGEANARDVRVHEVTRITDDGVFGQRLAPADVEVAEATGRNQDGAVEPRPAASLDRWTPFWTSAGERVAISCSLEPVIHLKDSARIGYRVAGRVQRQPGFAALTPAEFQRLAPVDIERIDLATIACGVDRQRLAVAGRKPPGMILPMAHTTLQSRRGRATLIGLLQQARALVTHGLICEITGVGAAPAASLLEAVAAIRPVSLAVIGRLAGASDDARHLVGVGLDGVSMRCRARTPEELIEATRMFVRVNGRVAKSFLLYQLPDLELAHAAARIGITHATLAPQRLRFPLPDDEPR